jgi:hypothetical protein
MIKGISQGGRYITVTGGNPGSNYINNYSGAQGIGNMRFNTSNQNMEVWDGNNWMTLQGSYATVQLDDEAIRILDWARDKRQKEIALETLAKENPVIKAALENFKRAEEQLEVTIHLAKDYDQTTS